MTYLRDLDRHLQGRSRRIVGCHFQRLLERLQVSQGHLADDFQRPSHAGAFLSVPLEGAHLRRHFSDKGNVPLHKSQDRRPVPLPGRGADVGDQPIGLAHLAQELGNGAGRSRQGLGHRRPRQGGDQHASGDVPADDAGHWFLLLNNPFSHSSFIAYPDLRQHRLGSFTGLPVDHDEASRG
jgi:hypothetical protein